MKMDMPSLLMYPYVPRRPRDVAWSAAAVPLRYRTPHLR
ncbi:hypothetical protein XCR_3028 [Xanthomonas campestris pv. raphani 756C]|nr:hypothetical protein XCR_3028 [Xanthomonas campestris pv. raphani 756C]